MTEYPEIKVEGQNDLKPTKAIVAGIGATLTALAAMWATVSVAYESNGIDIGEAGTILTAALLCVGTIRAVWQVTNKPVS